MFYDGLRRNTAVIYEDIMSSMQHDICDHLSKNQSSLHKHIRMRIEKNEILKSGEIMRVKKKFLCKL